MGNNGMAEDKRIQILLAQMNERTGAWHRMRDRGMQFTLWILGLAIAASWWIIRHPSDSLSLKIIITALVVVLGLAAFHFLQSLSRGVQSNKEVLVNIEKALGLYEKGIFLNGTSLLPAQYQNSKAGTYSHFATLYILLIVTAVFLLSIIWIPFVITTG